MRELDALDKKIFGLLAGNGRMSNLDVAAKVGVSEKTVRQRIRRLIERDGMRVVATLDRQTPPSRLIVLVRVRSGQRFVVADRLASLPEVDEVHLTTGAYELIVRASFESDSDALEFYVRHVEQGPGIEESLSTHVVETITSGTAARPDHFEQFDKQASKVGSLSELLDLACEVATASLGADRVHVATGNVWPADPASRWPATMRWRGLSSRYVEEIRIKGQAEGVVLPNIVKHNQHVFVADAQTDPLFQSVTDLVFSEGFRSWMGMPVCNGDTRRGTFCLYWNTVITYREDLVRQAQELADTLGKHLVRYSPGSSDASSTPG
ncbi:AsnC family transcriptional regulator [Amycolatopsis pithecellobii]|uniref:AsnC family transcriptional regulator n=1 Tax=Amycolatopsis pithecellobii TaxID=664692 RepID=A0A6N7Z521_9PSEU|nr:AsnC family transcriptional regulator [Amycolatopsis pithecellobii]MTD55530.1 AsnC family transcriptional regulator [Amycolatopsis pithecellobii]